MSANSGGRQFKILHADGRLEINPSQPQMNALTSEALVTGMQAGTGSGKTSVLALWLKMEMEKRGPGDYLMAAPTFPLMEPRVLPEFRELYTQFLGWGSYHPGYHRFESYERVGGEPAYRIFLGSAANPESLESATVKAAAIDELAQKQFNRTAWEAIRRRCGFHNGRIFYATTLYEVSSWYKTEIYDKWKGGDPQFNIIQCDSISNPSYPRVQWELAKASLPPWKFNMFHRGIYEKPTGLIYDAFEEETQVIEGFDLRQPQYKEWPRYTGHDFGPNNTAVVWVAQDPATGFLYVYREYLQGGLSVGQHAQEWKRLSRGEEVRLRAGGAWGEEEIRYAYTAAGWPIFKPALRDVEAGIDQVYSFIAKNQLFVFRDCQRFINEILTYSRELDENYESTDKIHAKSRFHCMDSLRYLLSGFSPERADGRKEPFMKVKREGQTHPGRHHPRFRPRARIGV